MCRVALVVAAVLLLPAARAQPTFEYFGDWVYGYEVDAITDEVFGGIYTAGVDFPAIAQMEAVALTMICWTMGGTPHVLALASGLDIGSVGDVTVDYRVDSEVAVQNVTWWNKGDGTVLVPFDASEELLKELLAGEEKLMVRLHPTTTGVSYTYQFSLVGLADVVERLGCE